MPRLTAFFRDLQKRPLLADFLSLAGMLAYALMLWNLVHIQFSVLDEGLYLYKGWLLATGKYIPFQDYGLWMNQMPLSYFIPGWVQMLFGPGLRTGRMFSFVLGLFAILGLWLTSRRLGGRWIAAGVVWALALNPSAARMSAMAASQGLIACLLVWTMFLTLGSDRKNWQLFLGGLLASVIVMVRINLLPLLPLLALYVLWEHYYSSPKFPGLGNLGEAGREWMWLLAGMLLVFGGVHLAYWPNILRLWARWLPLPFLASWFPPPNQPTWRPDTFLAFRVASFFLAFRAHFAALVGGLAALILWPKGRMKEEKTAIFLALFLLSSFLLHAWAALGNEYCVFCFQTYTPFYSGAGLLLAAVTLPAWRFDLPAWRKWLGGLAMFVLLSGMGYAAEGAVETLLGDKFYRRLLATPLPGFNGAQAWQVVANKFQMEYEAIFDAVHAYFPVLLAVGVGLVILAGGRLLVGRKNSGAFGAGLVLFLILGSVLSPTVLLAGEYKAYDCQSDVIPGYEAAGAELAYAIPPGSKVYWAGYSPATLLYLPGIELLPGQLHGVYSFRISDDDDALRRYGWWNQSLAEKWLAEADFVLVEARNLNRDDWLNEQLANFEMVAETVPQSCQPESVMMVFRPSRLPSP